MDNLDTISWILIGLVSVGYVGTLVFMGTKRRPELLIGTALGAPLFAYGLSMLAEVALGEGAKSLGMRHVVAPAALFPLVWGWVAAMSDGRLAKWMAGWTLALLVLVVYLSVGGAVPAVRDAVWFGEDHVPASTTWRRITNLVCVVGLVLSVWAIREHWGQFTATRRGETPGPRRAMRVCVAALGVALTTLFISVWNRGVEVNHFPSQTMSEVLVVFSLAMLVAMFVLHFVLRLRDFGYGWEVLGAFLVFTAFLSTLAVNVHASTLTTGQRDLPPALQSYWFPPHLAALIFSYATLYLAGILAIAWFAARFWSGTFLGGRSVGSQLLVLGLLTLLPFAQLLTIPVLIVCGLVWLALKTEDALPQLEGLAAVEKTMDQVSFRAFAVGIPFLTAGLFMGAFWAQEAWANYWGWDSKENAALITWLVYVIYIHLRMLGGYRGEKAMSVLVGGALSVFFTFQLFGYFPDSQKSLHRYTDDGVVPQEGQMGGDPGSNQQARLDDGGSTQRGG